MDDGLLLAVARGSPYGRTRRGSRFDCAVTARTTHGRRADVSDVQRSAISRASTVRTVSRYRMQPTTAAATSSTAFARARHVRVSARRFPRRCGRPERHHPSRSRDPGAESLHSRTAPRCGRTVAVRDQQVAPLCRGIVWRLMQRRPDRMRQGTPMICMRRHTERRDVVREPEVLDVGTAFKSSDGSTTTGPTEPSGLRSKYSPHPFRLVHQ